MHFPILFNIHPSSLLLKSYMLDADAVIYTFFSQKVWLLFPIFCFSWSLTVQVPFAYILLFYYPRNSLLTLLLQACFSLWVWTVKQHAPKNNIKPYAKTPTSKAFPVQTPNKRFQNKRDHSTSFSRLLLCFCLLLCCIVPQENWKATNGTPFIFDVFPFTFFLLSHFLQEHFSPIPLFCFL